MKHKIPAIPPQDYSGTIVGWETTLISKGLMNPHQFYGEVYITPKQYNEVLEETEE